MWGSCGEGVGCGGDCLVDGDRAYEQEFTDHVLVVDVVGEGEGGAPLPLPN